MTIQVIYFSAEWCGPCKTQTPIIKNVMNTYEETDEVRVKKFDVEEYQDFANALDVRSIPSIIVLSHDEPFEDDYDSKDIEFHERFVGITNEELIVEVVEELIDE